ncbi:Cmx/CmrA family chloramphenicol efflux MFS transporter [Streptomyces gamaensis]|uniref:Cmx/CmrA family chloramphenicol efflux MFS transporter n=1 Tax=Streptomyces gamaensis TaxID=1763542 RepID=A0ABW0YWX0_9ACTN
MPFVIHLLALGIFAQGTSEFMLSGLLPGLAADLGVSVPDAGLLISGFAVGMLLGAPVLAVATLRLPRRATLLGFQAVFVAGHVVGALAPGYATLLATRFVSAFAYAGFWAVAAATGVALVPPQHKARAISVIAAGLSLATVVGVPAGTLLAQHAGWRAAFWAVAGLNVISMAAIAAFLPRSSDTGARERTLRGELAAFARPRLWLAYGVTALSCGAAIVTFSYLAALLAEVSGVPEGWVPAVLALYGVGALVGLAVGGRTADARPFATLGWGTGALALVSLALWLAAGNAAVAVALVFLLGLLGFVTNPAVQARVFTIAGDAPTLAGAVNTSAFNVGITLAPMLGGFTIDAGLGYASVGWVAAALAAAALAASGAAALAERRHRERASVPEAHPNSLPKNRTRGSIQRENPALDVCAASSASNRG